MLEVSKDLLDAFKWFKSKEFSVFMNDRSIYIDVNSYEIMVSSSEVSYRAELWRIDNNEGADTPS